jgi:hypothetical protein
MSNAAAIQSARFNMALRRRGRQFASALTVHASGLAITGADQFDGMLQSGAMFVQSEVDGQPWVALTSGTSGATPLSGTSTMSDGSIVWQPWPGIIRSMPPTP